VDEIANISLQWLALQSCT